MHIVIVKNAEIENNCCISYLEFEAEIVHGRLTRTCLPTKEPAMLVLLMEVFLLQESGVYR